MFKILFDLTDVLAMVLFFVIFHEELSSLAIFHVMWAFMVTWRPKYYLTLLF